MASDGSSLKLEDALKLIKNASDNSLELINDLLGLSNIEPGKLKKEATDVNRFIAGCVRLLEFKANEKQQTLTVHLPEKPLNIQVNQEKMNRVINNLVGNAIKFSNEGGQIIVAVSQKGNDLQIMVKDNGIGIPAQLQPKVFDVFSPARRMGTRGERSYGLGLSISRQIVEALRGHIVAENRRDATGAVIGARFVVTLPKG